MQIPSPKLRIGHVYWDLPLPKHFFEPWKSSQPNKPWRVLKMIHGYSRFPILPMVASCWCCWNIPWICFSVIVHGFFHGKSPLNHHLGIFDFFPTTKQTNLRFLRGIKCINVEWFFRFATSSEFSSNNTFVFLDRKNKNYGPLFHGGRWYDGGVFPVTPFARTIIVWCLPCVHCSLPFARCDWEFA